MSWRNNRKHYGKSGNFKARPFKRKNQVDHSVHEKRSKQSGGTSLREEEVGITELVGSHKRFTAILKERFSDFNVHEISCTGEICKLTDQEIPPEPQNFEDLGTLKESLPEDIRKKLEEFSSAGDGDTTTSPLKIDVTEFDKALRKNIHLYAKNIMPSVISETVEEEGRKKIVLAKSKKSAGHKFRGDQRVDWSNRGGNYCHFILHKVNLDTMDALNQLAAKLRLKSSAFEYAGTKDRRARTTQWVSLKKISPATIHSAAKRVKGAHVGNFKFAKEPLRLGMLNGNHFKIALRSVDATDEEIEEAVKSLRDKGFINYYGLQRFGTTASVPTYEIGKALLQGKMRDAIDLILKPRPGEQQADLVKARSIYERTKDAKLALEPIARSGKIEAKLLHGIVKSGEKNPHGALDHIPRNTRLMYIHAYQSLVWNQIVSRRIREFGMKPIVGDLVYKVDSKNAPESETIDYDVENDDGAEPENMETTSPDSSIKDAESTKNGAEDETANSSRDEHQIPNVIALTEDDLEKYTIADIVMPKPGWRVIYPSYAKAWYDEILTKDGLSMDLKGNKKYSLGGDYRKFVETPSDLTWKIVRYNGYHDDLIFSDIDEMRGMEAVKEDTDGKHKALILEFSLKPSTYATMALREILKLDTSAPAQAAQSAANQVQDNLEMANDVEKNTELTTEKATQESHQEES